MVLKVNDIYPTDESLDHFFIRAKARLPITDENELIALLFIHQNTIINQMISNPEKGILECNP